MAPSITEQDLCEALSDLFIIGKIDYAAIAGVCSNFSVDFVEEVLVDWVGPVLYSQFFITTPEVWGFDRDLLWDEVQVNLPMNRSVRPFNKMAFAVRRVFIRWTLKQEWAELKAHLKPGASTHS
jgi:hypothetical protein